MKKQIFIILTTLFLTGMTTVAMAGNKSSGSQNNMMSNNMMSASHDTRISLGLSPMMKQHQLANMRGHIEAIQKIVGLIAAGKFDNASEIAHSDLGLTDKMKKMCSMFTNADFRQLGFAFHKSADQLAVVLKTRNTQQSLQALHTTMHYCVQCHATFRQ